MSQNCLNCKYFKEYYSLTPRGASRELFGRCSKTKKVVDIQGNCKKFTEKEDNAEINLSSVIYTLNHALTDIRKIKFLLEHSELK